MTSLLDFLLQHYHAAIDSQLLQSAARNKYRGTQMIELLLAKCPADMEVERDVIVAAMSNHFCGRSLLDLFLRKQPDFEVARDVVEAASENEVLSKVLLQMLLKQSLALCSAKSTDLVHSKMKSIVHGLRDSLFLAVCYQDDSILNFLISRDVSISTISGELGTALNVAVYAGNGNAVEILLDEGSDLTSCSKLYGTPLQSACQQGNLEILRTLAQYGVEIDWPKQMGRTELHTALRKGHFDLVDVLISLGASTAKRDFQEMAAMHHACLFTESAACVNRLIESGAPVDQEDSQQWTPLHWAAKSGAANTVARLLEAGASKTKIDASGQTPFQIAMFCGNVHLRPTLFLFDSPDLDTDPVGEDHHEIECDACDLVSLKEFIEFEQKPSQFL